MPVGYTGIQQNAVSIPNLVGKPNQISDLTILILHPAGVDFETRAKILGHSIETASRYRALGESEIKKTASLLDHAEAAKRSRSDIYYENPLAL